MYPEWTGRLLQHFLVRCFCAHILIIYILFCMYFRQEYVNHYISYIFNTSIQKMFTAFHEGFHKVCGSKVLVCFILSFSGTVAFWGKFLIKMHENHCFTYAHMLRMLFFGNLVCSILNIFRNVMCSVDYIVLYCFMLQSFFHPLELQAMVVGNEACDWEELEKVCFYS